MKILKELDRQVFTERFTTNQDCYEFLADLKWSEGYTSGQNHTLTFNIFRTPLKTLFFF